MSTIKAIFDVFTLMSVVFLLGVAVGNLIKAMAMFNIDFITIYTACIVAFLLGIKAFVERVLGTELE